MMRQSIVIVAQNRTLSDSLPKIFFFSLRFKQKHRQMIPSVPLRFKWEEKKKNNEKLTVISYASTDPCVSSATNAYQPSLQNIQRNETKQNEAKEKKIRWDTTVTKRK